MLQGGSGNFHVLNCGRVEFSCHTSTPIFTAAIQEASVSPTEGGFYVRQSGATESDAQRFFISFTTKLP